MWGTFSKNFKKKCLVKTHHTLSLRRCETLWSAREIASMALSPEQARHTENVFHIALRKLYDPFWPSRTARLFFFWIVRTKIWRLSMLNIYSESYSVYRTYKTLDKTHNKLIKKGCESVFPILLPYRFDKVLTLSKYVA